MGMGNYYYEISRSFKNGQKIGSITTSDWLIPAGVSNWGGYALAAALSLLLKKNLLPSPAQEFEVVQKIVDAGAVDGTTGKCQVTVDGLPVQKYLSVLKAVYRTVRT